MQVVLITALAAVASGAFLPNQGLLPLGELHSSAVLVLCGGLPANGHQGTWLCQGVATSLLWPAPCMQHSSSIWEHWLH